MSIFGLTGNLASGKTAVLELLKKKGALVFDSDRRVHSHYQDKNGEIYKKIVKKFPNALSGKKICRKKLSKIIFSHQENLKTIENIVHPVVINELIEWTAKAKKQKGVCVAEVPLLFEKRLDAYFKDIILVLASQDILIKRIVKKYKISKSAALGRLALFAPAEKKIKGASFIINNNKGLKDLKKEVDVLWEKIKQK